MAKLKHGLSHTLITDMIFQILDDEENQTIFSAWDEITDGVPQGLFLGPLLFLIYVNDLPKTVSDKSIAVLFANDTSIIVESSNSKDFVTNMVTPFDCVNKWFKVTLLSTNVNKTPYIQFKTKTSPHLI
jgi:hypothetical protein